MFHGFHKTFTPEGSEKPTRTCRSRGCGAFGLEAQKDVEPMRELLR